MRADHTRASRSASITAAALVLAQLVHAIRGHHDSYVDALLLTLVVATAVAAAKLHRDNCLESRVAVSLLAAMSGVGFVLALTVGLPGQEVRAVSVLPVTIVVLATTLVVLLIADLPRRSHKHRTGSSYAS